MQECGVALSTAFAPIFDELGKRLIEEDERCEFEQKIKNASQQILKAFNVPVATTAAMIPWRIDEHEKRGKPDSPVQRKSKLAANEKIQEDAKMNTTEEENKKLKQKVAGLEELLQQQRQMTPAHSVPKTATFQLQTIHRQEINVEGMKRNQEFLQGQPLLSPKPSQDTNSTMLSNERTFLSPTNTNSSMPSSSTKPPPTNETTTLDMASGNDPKEENEVSAKQPPTNETTTSGMPSGNDPKEEDEVSSPSASTNHTKQKTASQNDTIEQLRKEKEEGIQQQMKELERVREEKDAQLEQLKTELQKALQDKGKDEEETAALDQETNNSEDESKGNGNTPRRNPVRRSTVASTASSTSASTSAPGRKRRQNTAKNSPPKKRAK